MPFGLRDRLLRFAPDAFVVFGGLVWVCLGEIFMRVAEIIGSEMRELLCPVESSLVRDWVLRDSCALNS